LKQPKSTIQSEIKFFVQFRTSRTSLDISKVKKLLLRQNLRVIGFRPEFQNTSQRRRESLVSSWLGLESGVLLANVRRHLLDTVIFPAVHDDFGHVAHESGAPSIGDLIL
jgi:hypothetical protein